VSRLITSEPRFVLRITQTRLDEAAPYEAISYTWGPAEDRQTIVCGPEGAVIPVTRNCESVLRRLRDLDSPRLVWVDAICIDQDDIDERNAQVAMMGQIYQNATRVIVDVGETSPDSDYALDAIVHCSEKALYAMELGLNIRNTVNELYRRPWFQRVWVLQEVFRSRETTA
jgi:Heterokaryon incompatibility protein (HET)